MNRRNYVLEQIKRIPHLPLGMQFDAARMRAEYEALSNPLEDYDSRSLVPGIRKHLAKNWKGFALTSSDGDPYSDLTERSRYGAYFPTLFAAKCPYLMEVARAFTQEPPRARVLTIEPQANITWHSHNHDEHLTEAPWLIVTHVPIIMPPECVYGVIPHLEFRTFDPKVKWPTVYEQRYEAGEAWLFNSTHYHNVLNRGDHRRVTLMLYMMLSDDKAFQIVSDAVERYTGPLID